MQFLHVETGGSAMTRPRRDYVQVTAKVHPDAIVEMKATKHPGETTTEYIEQALIREAMRRKGAQI